MLRFYRIKSFNSKKLSERRPKHDTADCRYFGSTAQVTFPAIEITLPDRSRLILSVYLAIVVVACRFYCTPVFKNPGRYTFPFCISFKFFAPKHRPGAIGKAVSFTETRSSQLLSNEISQFPTPVWRKIHGTMFGLFVLLLLFYGIDTESLTANILYCQGLHLGISWKFHNFLVSPEIVYNKSDS